MSFASAQAMYELREPPICDCPDDCSGCYAVDAGMSECCGHCSDSDEEWSEREDEWRSDARADRDG